MDQRPPLLRRKLLVDKSIQVPLLIYSFALATVGLALASITTVLWVTQNPTSTNTIEQIVFFLIGAFVAVGVMIFLGLVLTNRVAGPLLRLKKHMVEVEKGQNPPPLVARSDDFLSAEFIDQYNRVAAKANKS